MWSDPPYILRPLYTLAFGGTLLRDGIITALITPAGPVMHGCKLPFLILNGLGPCK